MRILLVNEASGVQSSLAAGLRELGHEVVHAVPHGVSRQLRRADVMLGVEGSGPLKAIERMIAAPMRLRRLGHFDVVHFVLGITALASRWQRHRDLPRFLRQHALISYTGLGCDEIALLRVREGVQARSPCAGCEALDDIGAICRSQILSRRPATALVATAVDVCITPMPDYDHAAAFFPNARAFRIPLPVRVPKPSAARRDGLLRLANAPSRRGFKGTDVILAAIKILRASRDDFEFNILENLPHDKFLKRLADADMLIDQVHSFGAGMAALEALAQGKVVVSGNAQEMRAYFAWGAENPIVDASAEPVTLAARIAALLDDPLQLAARADDGVSYIRRRHDAVVVASQYVEAWSMPRPARRSDST